VTRSHPRPSKPLRIKQQKSNNESPQIAADLGSSEAAITPLSEALPPTSSSSVTKSSQRPHILRTCKRRPGPSAASLPGGAPSTLTAVIIPQTNDVYLRAIVVNARVSPGHTVLITGIGGGVALLAMQFCLALGARVFVTSGSDEKLARAMDLGAAGGVNYRHSQSRFLANSPPARPDRHVNHFARRLAKGTGKGPWGNAARFCHRLSGWSHFPAGRPRASSWRVHRVVRDDRGATSALHNARGATEPAAHR
jgi:hypothetical protein